MKRGKAFWIGLLIIFLHGCTSIPDRGLPKMLPFEERDTRMKYCQNRTAFVEAFVKPNLVLPKDMSVFMDDHCKKRCTSTAYVYFTVATTHNAFQSGVFEMNKSDNCWMYYFEVRSKKRNDQILQHRYLTLQDTQGTGEIHSLWNETIEDFGDTLTFRLVRIPGGQQSKIIRGYYKNECHKLAYGYTVKFYWARINEQTVCRKYYDEWNVYTVSNKVCESITQHHHGETSSSNISPLTISKYVNQSLVLNKCTLYFNQMVTEVRDDDGSFSYNILYILLSVMVVAIVIVMFMLVICLKNKRRKHEYRQKAKKRHTLKKVEQNEKLLNKAVLPLEQVSVMILHRAGCELLDNFVRDLSYVIHSYDIHVTSPLLEMSNIDAEGGIASYMQRNIDRCTYILVLITALPIENQDTYLNRPFEFAMKILSGLAFRDNEASRYIPIYLNEYTDIIAHIPPFLCATRGCGFRVPSKLKNLVGYMKQTPLEEIPKENEAKLRFFLQKLETQAHNIDSYNPHKNCYVHHCSQGVLEDNGSFIWTGASSVCARNTEEHEIPSNITTEPIQCIFNSTAIHSNAQCNETQERLYIGGEGSDFAMKKVLEWKSCSVGS